MRKDSGMNLEGALSAFGLSDVFTLLTLTKKTGALHLFQDGGGRRPHGVVYVQGGQVTGATSDAGQQQLVRRLVGAGAVPEDALQAALQRASAEAGVGLAHALHAGGAVDGGLLREFAAEQAVDAVFDLLRWTDGSFGFAVDEANPDDVGLRVDPADLVREGRSRMEAWAAFPPQLTSPNSVLSLAIAPEEEPRLSREEWTLLSLVDGRRSVRDVVTLSGRGRFATVSVLASLAARGLVVVPDESDQAPGGLAARQRLLAALDDLEQHDGDAASSEPAAGEPAPPPRRPEQGPGTRTVVGGPPPLVPAGSLPSRPTVDGTAAVDPARTLSEPVDDLSESGVSKALLLRLINGVRGL